jgi:hypothetical protein
MIDALPLGTMTFSMPKQERRGILFTSFLEQRRSTFVLMRLTGDSGRDPSNRSSADLDTGIRNDKLPELKEL